MDTLDVNIFTDCICPYLTGEIIDNVLLVNKNYNAIVKADMKHLYNLFWEIKEGQRKYGLKYKEIYKDGNREGEQLGWYRNGKIYSKEFYKKGKNEGEQIWWFENGKIWYKEFFKNGVQEGEQLIWYADGRLKGKNLY